MKLGLVGIGAIARKEHVPAIQATEGVELVATASRSHGLDGVARFQTIGEMLAALPEIDAVALCAPPAPRHAMAQEAIAAGKHVFLEKPPGVTVAEVLGLEQAARAKGVSLFTSWHSRHAHAVPELRRRLATDEVQRVAVTWKEDVRVYHPGQEWIWEPGGYGVFDPVINALSILTNVLPRPFRTIRSAFQIPENRRQPIAAAVDFEDVSGVPIRCEASFDQPEPASWDIEVETTAGRYLLQRGGASLSLDGVTIAEGEDEEYRRLYERFVDLVARRESDVDITPLQHVADAFLLASHDTVRPFFEDQR